METDPWTVVTAISTAVAAVAACLSAAYSWRAASNSAKSSERATEALASTIAPLVITRGVYQTESVPPTAYVAVNNDLGFLARDVEVEVLRRDGRKFVATRDFLRKNDEAPITVDIGPVDGPTEAGWEFLRISRITLRFSDERDLARYERIEEYGHLSEPPMVPTVSERRLKPTPGPFVRQTAILVRGQ